jgi:hypothetical protein
MDMLYLPAEDFFFFFSAPPGRQTGQGSAPRYLWPRVHVFQPPRFAFDMTGSISVDGDKD